MDRRRRGALLATAALALSPGWVRAQADGGGPVYTYAPRALPAGGTITVTGSRFDRGAAAGVSLISSTGDLLVLGVAPVSQGAFSRSFPVPSTLAAGRYFVFVNDSTQRVAINLVGSLTVTARGRPWFTYAGTTASPGDPLTIRASGFDPASTAAVAGVLDAEGGATTFGVAPLVGGGFERTFRLPDGLPPGTYFPFVRDLARPVFGQNVDGPLTVPAGPPPPTAPVGFYPIGAAVDLLTGRVYVPNGGDDTLSVLDGGGNQLATIPVGALPCAIGFNPRSNRVYVANVNSHDVSVVDGASGSVMETVPVGRNPCAVAVLPALDRVFVGNYTGDSVSVIDGAANSVTATIPVGRGPFGIAANSATSRVYVVNGYDSTVSAIDGVTGAVVATAAVGREPDAVGVNPATGRVYVANFFGNTVTVLEGSTLEVLATVPVGREPDGVAVNWMTNRVYVSNYSSDTVSVIDGAANAVVATIPVGDTPDGLAVNPRTGLVYVSNSNSNSISLLADPP